jgi:uncharacterized membrane protein YtjA (UPF0391 family)
MLMMELRNQIDVLKLWDSKVTPNSKENDMLRMAVVFLIIALIAGVFGFGGIASASAGMAKIVFGIFIILFLISALMGALKGRAPL